MSEQSSRDPTAAAAEERSRLFLRHEVSLRGYLRALLRNEPDADDLLQELGVKVLTHPDAPLDPDHFPNWCRAVARHLVLHHFRSRRRTPIDTVDPLSDVIDQAYDEADAAFPELEPRRRALAECLSRLNGRSRELLRQRYVEDRSSEEIGRQRGKSAAAIRMNLMRLREVVARCLQRRMGEAKVVA